MTNSSDIISSVFFFFLDLNISISDGFVSTKIYDKRDDINFNMVFAFHNLYVLLRRVDTQVISINTFCLVTNRSSAIIYNVNILKFYFKNHNLLANYNTNLKTFLRQGITNPDSFGDVVYKFRKMGHGKFSQAFSKIIKRFINRLKYIETYCMLGVQTFSSWSLCSFNYI